MNAFYRAGLILITVLPLVSCDQQKQAAKVPEKPGAELSNFIAEIKENLIYVEGGEFLMGDYGEQYGPEHLPYDARQHSKPLHKVELTGYSIGKFKTSNKEYQFYLAYNNLPGRDVDLRSRTGQRWREMNMTPETPAHVDWFEAEKYCQWLAVITELPFSLPTEAQWEYAARSRGRFVIVPTDDGTIQIKERNGINITTSDDREIFAREQGTRLGILSPMPRDARPPNPLGIYDMVGNGWEWIKDWYDPDYYKYSPVKDPQGPEKPVFKDIYGNYTKVIRSQDFSGPRRGATIFRFDSDPANEGDLPDDKTVRCVVNSADPIK
ncbi:formylglycine-generating enzyme family protein [Leclercia adecarboxylata]|uniref:formylglycine-generating enzyme family protein n=1 Tax=Leclercia adecarboxylata TaxID=83655 RepID=UPI0021CF6403|nr:formylglycine-generating enzyme family protein [Leclercia adecarboxylata]MCU6674766.1 formylglycine-generating enzyme family protein [Leclercia adecarboxylata]